MFAPAYMCSDMHKISWKDTKKLPHPRGSEGVGWADGIFHK